MSSDDIKRAINRLVEPKRAERTLPPAQSTPSIPASIGSAEPVRRGSTNSGIASPLTEVSREHTGYETSTDGIFTWDRVSKIIYQDAQGRSIEVIRNAP
jgi:hypothetical protein